MDLEASTYAQPRSLSCRRRRPPPPPPLPLSSSSRCGQLGRKGGWQPGDYLIRRAGGEQLSGQGLSSAIYSPVFQQHHLRP